MKCRNPAKSKPAFLHVMLFSLLLGISCNQGTISSLGADSESKGQDAGSEPSDADVTDSDSRIVEASDADIGQDIEENTRGVDEKAESDADIPELEPECKRDDDCADPGRPICWAGICIPSQVQNPDIDNMPYNTWTKIEDIETGGRNSAMFVYSPQAGRFILTGGTPGGRYNNAVVHYNTEFFDLGSFRWINAYPPNSPDDYAPESGPTRAPAHDKRYSFEDENGISRIAIFPNAYGVDSRAHYQYVYLTDEAKLFAFIWNKTAMYDPLERSWQVLDTTVTPTENTDSFSKGSRMMIWGSLGYDPIHREVVLVGGTAPMEGGSPGTWVFSLDRKEWRKLKLGSERINSLREQVGEAEHKARRLVALSRNRYYHAEYDNIDLEKTRRNLAAQIDGLSKDLASAALKGHESDQRDKALLHVDSAKSNLASVSLSNAVTANSIVKIQETADSLMYAGYALSVEPPARALSKMAYHQGTKQLVLFGGDGLDRHFADTWHYDCETRTWQQVYPPRSPSPRAGHALVSLPGSDKILLFGGYGLGNGHSYTYNDTYKKLPFETWIYDPESVEWKLLKLGASGEENTPPGDPWGPWPAAADKDDIVVLVPSGRTGRQTWIFKPKADEIDEAGTVERGVPPETIAFRGDEDAPRPGSRSYDPLFYDKNQSPDPVSTARLWSGIETNVWTKIEQPKPVDVRGWGTTAFDPDSRQFIYWGGGHSEYKGTNVFHYSIDCNLWSISSAPEWVIEWTTGFRCPQLISFHNRPHVPLHAYQAYAYDPVSRRMITADQMTFVYDIEGREWEHPPLDTPFRADVLHESLETTPLGVVAWADTGNQDVASLFLFDHADKTWKKLEINGPTIGRPWCDGSGMLYDRNRNAIWLVPKHDIYLYKMDTHELAEVETNVPAIVGDYAFWREQTLLPDRDIIMLMRRFDGPNGRKVNVFYNPSENKWYAAAIPFSDGEEHTFSWSSALWYDDKTGLVFLHNPVSFWVLKLDFETAGLEEIE